MVTVTASPMVGGEISDVGIALDSYQQSPANEPPYDQLPLEMLAQEQRQLSRIAQKLGPIHRQKQLQQGVAKSELSGSGGSDMTGRDSMSSNSQPSLRIDWAHSVSPTAIKTHKKRMETPVTERSDAQVAAVGYQAHSQPSRRTSSWGLSMLLFGGIFSLTCGISLLVHATVTGVGQGASMPGDSIWQGGMTFTLAGEGMLIAGLTGMAIRLWRNGRRVNHQLQGVDRQLAELQYQYQSDAQRGMRTSTSSTYYDHFAQGISSPILMANLRGGLDQLAKRMK
ncbi:MAG: hypothetical protein ABGX16_05840 [Pirellulales bacterium]